jgi:hypothetical protein
MTQIIEVTISPTGETKVQTKGFVGATCRDASQFIEQALGQRAQEQLTGEFYIQQGQQQSLREGA